MSFAVGGVPPELMGIGPLAAVPKAQFDWRPLALLACMPVAFCVFWWDAPLSEWNRGSVMAGARVLASNVLLSVAYIASFASMFAVRANVKQLVLAARVLFGAWLLLSRSAAHGGAVRGS